jgi:dienelactone hydrolase
MQGYSVYHYTNATHAYDIPRNNIARIYGYTIAYDKEAAELTHERVREFLKSTIGNP